MGQNPTKHCDDLLRDFLTIECTQCKWQCMYKCICIICNFLHSNICNGICLLSVLEHCLVVRSCLHVYSYACLHAMHVCMHACVYVCMHMHVSGNACVMHKPSHCWKLCVACWLQLFVCYLPLLSDPPPPTPHASPLSAHLLDNMEP